MEFLINVFAAIGIVITAIVLVSALMNAIESLKRWRTKRKIDRRKNCYSCVHTHPSKPCRTCRRNPEYLDNWRIFSRNRLEDGDND